MSVCKCLCVACVFGAQWITLGIVYTVDGVEHPERLKPGVRRPGKRQEQRLGDLSCGPNTSPFTCHFCGSRRCKQPPECAASGPLGESKGREEWEGTQFMQGGSGVPAEKIQSQRKNPTKSRDPEMTWGRSQEEAAPTAPAGPAFPPLSSRPWIHLLLA